MKMQANSLSPKWPEQRGRGLHFVRSAINSALVEAPLGVGYRLHLWVIQILIQEKTPALWTKPWRNFFHYFEIMVSNDSMKPETLVEHG